MLQLDWLVVWNMTFIFHILGIIIKIDFHIFQRGRAQPPTSHASSGLVRDKLRDPRQNIVTCCDAVTWVQPQTPGVADRTCTRNGSQGLKHLSGKERLEHIFTFIFI